MDKARAAFGGRQAELAALDEAFGRAVRFSVPQTVTIVGAGSSGKSRLLDGWLAAGAPAEARIVRAAIGIDGASPLARAVVEAPPRGALIAHLLRVRLRLAELGPDEAQLRFRNELEVVFGDRRVSELAMLLGRYLGFERPESPLGSALAARPEQEAELARAVLARFFEHDAATRPLILVGEDLQDADDDSLVELERLSGELTDARVLIIATARPDLLVRCPGWGHGAGNHVRIDLQPPGPAEAPGATQLGEAAAHARITALTPAERDVLARGAVFGDRFWTGGVVALGRLAAAPPDEAAVFAPDPTITEIQQMLESLDARGFVERVEVSPIPEEIAWAFRQTVERRLLEADVSPELMRQRKAFAAQWLETRGGDEAEKERRLEALAQLYEQAGDVRRAAYCFVTAAGRARDHLRLDQAHALYLAGLRLLDIDDAVAKMDALYAAGDVAARLGRTREAVGLFQDMLRLAWRMDMPAKGGAAHGRIGRLCSTLGENARARAHLELARKLFEVAGDWPGVAAALDDVGRVHFLMGDPERSLERHREALGVRQQLGDDRGRSLTLSRLGQVLRATGALAPAGEHFRAALDLRRAIGDVSGVIASLLDLGALERDLGHRAEALALLGEGRELARNAGERLQACSLTIEIGDCLLAEGQPHAAHTEFSAAREIARQFGARGLLSEATRGIAEAELA
ncbi:MAG TPA: tetratricopeptide repeat protein, partial [Polyangia bacterium]|nr:tetratricopeptide repeat protein [Polyangia bacterium]